MSERDSARERWVLVAVGALLEMRQGRPQVLIARRREQTVLAGYWELPGGKLHEGESLAECLVREFEEELGIQVRVGEALPAVEYEYPHAHVRLHPFLCTRLAGEPSNLEVAEHRWVGADMLADFRFPPANAAMIQAVIEVMNNGSRAMTGGGTSACDERE